MVTDEMVKAAQGYFIKRSLEIDCGVIPTYDATKCALEAALRAAVPEVEPVAVKPLEWEHLGGDFYRAPAPLFGSIRIECYGATDFVVCWSVPGLSDTFTKGSFPTVEAAKAAAQTDYDQRIRSAIVPAPRPDMERELAEARARIDAMQDTDVKLQLLYQQEDQIIKLEAERDALAADKARLEEAATEARELVGAIVGENQPAREWAVRVRDKIDAALSGASIPAPADKAEAFQQRVQPWMMACFGAEISGDRVERADRLLEEVFELLQSGGYDPARVAFLRDYVWGRDVGEPHQEVGGVMVTLAAYCLAHDLDMHDAGETELARIWTKVEKIRAKQAAKPKHSPLPVAISKEQP